VILIVYAKQGYLHSGKTIAVKKLSKTDDFSEKQFHDELICLMRVKHRNIVRFLGYCSDTQQKMVQFNGRFVLAEIRRRFLCFEYVPNKSLLHYLEGVNPTTFICIGFSSMHTAFNYQGYDVESSIFRSLERKLRGFQVF
jgi:serine/threonine protein kinase